VLKTHLPEDIQNLIITANQTPRPDPELLEILPPGSVQRSLLAELGMTAPLRESEQQVARDWLSRQLEVQAEAMQVLSKLQENEPFSPEEAKMGRLPVWATKKWANDLNFMWADKLSTAVNEAREYLG